MKTAMKLVLAGVVVVGGVMVVKSRGHHAAPTDGGDVQVSDRIWIDHLPKSQRDPIQIFVMSEEHKVGVFDQRSMWKGSFEAFRFQQTGSAVRVEFPQNGDKEALTARASECHGNDRDYCLDLGGASRGAKKYFSQEDWVIRGAHTDKELEAAIDAKLAPLFK